MSDSKFTVVKDISRIICELPQDVEIVGKDGSITANKVLIQFASPFLHKQIQMHPDAISIRFEFTNYSQAAIAALFEMVYTGELKVTDEELKTEVFEFAKDLEIKCQIPNKNF